MKVFAWWPPRAAWAPEMAAPAVLAGLQHPAARPRAGWRVVLAFLCVATPIQVKQAKRERLETLPNGFKFFSPLGLSLRL